MLLSNCSRILTVTILFSLVSACSGLKTIESTQPTEPSAATDQTGQQSESGQPDSGQAGASIKPVLPMVADPMAEQLPLDLIKAYDQVTSLLKSNETAQAIAKLEQTQVVFPKNSGPSYRLARIYLDQKDYAKALAAIEISLGINSKNYYAHNLKGVILREQGEFEKAKQAYLTAVATYPRHPESHLNLGILADIYMYDLPLALEHYEYYLQLIQNDDKKVSGWIMDLKRRMPKGE